MLLAVELHPEIHVVTYLENDWRLNRYESKDARVHYLFTGNSDPEIEFSNVYRHDDWTQEELEASERWLENFRNRTTYSSEQIAAINFAMNAILTKKS